MTTDEEKMQNGAGGAGTAAGTSAPAPAKTVEDRIAGVSNATGLENMLAEAREEKDRETQTKRRLANTAFWTSLGNTVGALGKFGVVAGSRYGRDVPTTDVSGGVSAAAAEAAKREENAKTRLRELQRLNASFRNQQVSDYYKAVEARNKAISDYQQRLAIAEAQAGFNAQRDAARHGNAMEEIDRRNEAALERDKQNNAARRGMQEDRQEHDAEQNKLNRDAAAEKAEKDRQAAAERTRINAENKGKKTGGKKRNFKRDKNNDKDI